MLEGQQQEKKTRKRTIGNAPDFSGARTQFAGIATRKCEVVCGVQVNGEDRADRLTQL